MVCYHSNETSLTVLVHVRIGFSAFYKLNLKILTSFTLVAPRSESVKDFMKD